MRLQGPCRSRNLRTLAFVFLVLSTQVAFAVVQGDCVIWGVVSVVLMWECDLENFLSQGPCSPWYVVSSVWRQWVSTTILNVLCPDYSGHLSSKQTSSRCPPLHLTRAASIHLVSRPITKGHCCLLFAITLFTLFS